MAEDSAMTISPDTHLMAFRHVRTDDPTSPHNDSRTRLLEKVLAHHAAEGFDVLELRRQMGQGRLRPYRAPVGE